VFPVRKVVEGHERMELGTKKGKIVLDLQTDPR